MRPLVGRLWLVLAAMLVAGCWPFAGLVYQEELAEPYELWAIDSMEDMMLCRAIGEGGCVGDGLPGDTVFAAGANDRFVAFARHPREWPNPPNRTITEYYYVIRTPQDAQRGPYGNVRGPFARDQFENEKRRLGLPEFSRFFQELS